jgi:hypothetical protein
MAEHKELGKVRSVHFGYGGYQDVQVVFRIEIGGKDWGSCLEYEGGWGHVSEGELLKPNSSYKWSHADRVKGIGEAAWKAFELVREAGVKSFKDLVDIPIEATFDGPFGKLKSVRVLKEVL